MRRKTYYFADRKKADYNEIFADSDVFEKFYEIRHSSGSEIIAIPDGSMDIQCVWKKGQMKMIVCGSVMNAIESELNECDRCFGARFKVGVIPENFRDSIDKITDNRVLLDSLMATLPLRKCMSEDLLLEQKADIMLNCFEYGFAYEDQIVLRYLIDNIEEQKGNVVISDIVEKTGYSHRHMNNVFKKNVGCSIKKYSEIIRMQQSLIFLKKNDYDAIYDELGFYDQPHFIHKFKDFFGITPKVYNKIYKKILVV